MLLLGCGSIIAAYYAWREFRWSGLPAWQRPELPKLTSEQIRNRAMVAVTLLLVGFVAVAAYNNRSLQGPRGDRGAQGPQGPAGANGSSIREIVSTSCAKDGCRVACEPDETLVSAFCIGRNGARLTDTLVLENGLLRAQCAPTVNSIVVTCTPTLR
uniref:Collagen-like protein n=1 Tax=Rhodopseudomonas palustris (strain BisA53) TaxID=316055 RepID=Q07MH3_RHOP5